VTNRGIDDRERERLLAVEPERLSRDALIRLVRDLQSALSGGAAPDNAATRKRSPATIVAGADYTLVFDGGSLGNPGLGYGSYEIVGNGETTAAQRLEFGDNMTNNQAEFHALIAGLEELLNRTGPKAKSLSIAVRGDSQLVIRGLTGEWRVKHPGLQPLHRHADSLLQRFGSVDIAWHPRSNSVRTFGH
jgi:ribonuclease HI